jgi:lipopolysaccharide biosynthesis protein
MQNKIKPIAIHLPQFHPTPENDEWWGKGFTEWTNVTKAKPRFEGHYQPHLPADLGFYDLRLEEARLEQESLAKQYGIHGFCYYHYWFNGRRILNEPVDRKLKNPKEDLPFMLCWANENWTRTWDGKDSQVLLKQEYSLDDDRSHMEFLCDNFFNDSRYIKHDGKPVFIVYRPKLFPNINQTIEVWRQVARDKNIGDIHIGYMQSWGVLDEPKSMGFDFGVEFKPAFGKRMNKKISFFTSVINRLVRVIKNKKNINTNDFIIDYESYVDIEIQSGFSTNVSPGLTPMWDNAARRKEGAIIINNSSPEKYGKWLNHIIKNYPWHKNKEKFLFINAWNEWAEGNHLEPCQKWGRKYLEKTKELLQNEFK